MKNVFSFALGNIWKWSNSLNRNDLINYIKKLDISGVELTFPTKRELYSFRLSQSNEQWLRSLKYVTIHAPFRLYEESEDEKDVLKQINKISALYYRINGKNVVIHPENQLLESDLLTKCKFQLSIENLPKKKSIPISKLHEILDKYPKMKLCLDVAHAYSWSKFETKQLIENFQNRISQIHFSGSYRKKNHQSLKTTSKAFLFSIHPIHHLNVPVVIEQEIERHSLKYLKEEIGYIKNYFMKMKGIQY